VIADALGSGAPNACVCVADAFSTGASDDGDGRMVKMEESAGGASELLVGWPRMIVAL
jgi:hypothetical protein